MRGSLHSNTRPVLLFWIEFLNIFFQYAFEFSRLWFALWAFVLRIANVLRSHSKAEKPVPFLNGRQMHRGNVVTVLINIRNYKEGKEVAEFHLYHWMCLIYDNWILRSWTVNDQSSYELPCVGRKGILWSHKSNRFDKPATASRRNFMKILKLNNF